MTVADRFPYWIENAPAGGFLCRFPDFPDFAPEAPTLEKLLKGLLNAIIPVLEEHIKSGKPPIQERALNPGEEYLSLSPTLSVKLQLIYAVRERRITAHDLARRIGCYPQEATRILKFSHPTKIDTLNAAVEAIGGRLDCRVSLVTEHLPVID